MHLAATARTVAHGTTRSKYVGARTKDDVLHEAKLGVNTALSTQEKKAARRKLRKLKMRRKWIRQKTEVTSRARLQLYSFEGSRMTGEWPAILKKKCMEKYDHGSFIQEANCYLRDCLWEEVKLARQEPRRVLLRAHPHHRRHGRAAGLNPNPKP